MNAPDVSLPRALARRRYRPAERPAPRVPEDPLPADPPPNVNPAVSQYLRDLCRHHGLDEESVSLIVG